MAVVERLMKKGIAVKDCSTVRGAGERHIRLTVGTPDQNDRFLDAF
jgi:histidinol-phosphate aminotransferase